MTGRRQRRAAGSVLVAGACLAVTAVVAVAAVLILGFIRNGLTLMSISSDYQQWISGFLLLASVLITEIRIRR